MARPSKITVIGSVVLLGLVTCYALFSERPERGLATNGHGAEGPVQQSATFKYDYPGLGEQQVDFVFFHEPDTPARCGATLANRSLPYAGDHWTLSYWNAALQACYGASVVPESAHLVAEPAATWIEADTRDGRKARFVALKPAGETAGLVSKLILLAPAKSYEH